MIAAIVAEWLMYGHYAYSKASIDMKITIRSIIITFTLLSLPLVSKTQAVSPPPDGGYNLFSTAEGDFALFGIGPKGVAWEDTAIGDAALYGETYGAYNTAVGAGALYSNYGGFWNTAVGLASLHNNSTGSENSAFGHYSLQLNTSGFEDVALGGYALHSNTTGGANTAAGYFSLEANSTGNNNTGVGYEALRFTNGGGNTAVGASALKTSNGNHNTAIGFSAGANILNASNVICIGNLGQNINNSIFISNIYNVTPSQYAGSLVVIIDNNGQLGTITYHDLLQRLLQELGTKTAIGAGVFFDNTSCQPKSVPCEMVNAMLLNEFLKEHNTVQEQGAMIARQQKQIETLAAGLQKVSAQLEASRSAPQVASSNY